MILTIVRITIIVLIVAVMLTGLVGAKIVVPLGLAFLVLAIPYMIGGIICLYLPYSWTCDWAGTHSPGGKASFDGCSQHSKCRKCGADIMQDGQGNWF